MKPQFIRDKLHGNVHPEVINVIHAQQAEIATLEVRLKDTVALLFMSIELMKELLNAVRSATAPDRVLKHQMGVVEAAVAAVEKKYEQDDVLKTDEAYDLTNRTDGT